jgi:hypothetical protein
MPQYTSFEQVWRKIGGDSKSTEGEIIEALNEEISSREHLAHKLFEAKVFDTLTAVEQERMSFIQAKYGFQELPFLDRGYENESPIWKAALDKRQTMKLDKLINQN